MTGRRVLCIALLMLAAGCGKEPAKPQAAAPDPLAMPPEAPAPAPQPQAEIEAFSADGVIVAVHEFFDATQQAGDVELVAGDVSGKALVTADGLYAFIETPENKQQVGEVASGSAVHVTGMVYHPGRLLHVDAIEMLDTAPTLTLASYANDPGRQVTLTGKNKCQCGIKISELHTGCSLGHLHHLAADDGKLYHYLQFGDGQQLFQGKGTHFKDVQVTGTVLPGQWVLVQSMTMQ